MLVEIIYRPREGEMLKSIYLVSVISVGLISALSAQDTALFLSGGSGVTGNDHIAYHSRLRC